MASPNVSVSMAAPVWVRDGRTSQGRSSAGNGPAELVVVRKIVVLLRVKGHRRRHTRGLLLRWSVLTSSLTRLASWPALQTWQSRPCSGIGNRGRGLAFDQRLHPFFESARIPALVASLLAF